LKFLFGYKLLLLWFKELIEIKSKSRTALEFDLLFQPHRWNNFPNKYLFLILWIKTKWKEKPQTLDGKAKKSMLNLKYCLDINI